MKRWWTEFALVLSGGNALGAFQAGAYEALASCGMLPDRIAGSSIGSVNGVLVAGNAPEERVARLAEFWSMVSLPPAFSATSGRIGDLWSAQVARSVGRPGLYRPTIPRPIENWPMAGSAGLYSLDPLEGTLARLVDFDLLRSGTPRLTVRATDLATGEGVLFDSGASSLSPRAILASCALPPDFAPVELEGRVLGDGGLSANCPVLDVLEGASPTDMLVIAVDLMSPSGPIRPNLDDLFARRMEILLAANSAQSIQIARLRHEAAEDPGRLVMLHVVYSPVPEESGQRLFSFSEAALKRRWDAGRSAMLAALEYLPENPPAGFTYSRAVDPATGA